MSAPDVSLRKHHEWDALRKFPTVRDNAHESLTRSYQVLREVVAMLERGDSRETVLALIRFADGGYTWPN